jgi:hypothetical protein
MDKTRGIRLCSRGISSLKLIDLVLPLELVGGGELSELVTMGGTYTKHVRKRSNPQEMLMQRSPEDSATPGQRDTEIHCSRQPSNPKNHQCPAASERRGNPSKGFKIFDMKKQGKNLAMTVSYIPHSLDSGCAFSSRFKNNCFAVLRSSSKEGSYLRLVDFCIAQL